MATAARFRSSSGATSSTWVASVMDAYDLRQKDLVSIFVSESIVSEVLHTKRSY
jgi:antitoxin component HigA of HigAB toxin-antitoxin module